MKISRKNYSDKGNHKKRPRTNARGLIKYNFVYYLRFVARLRVLNEFAGNFAAYKLEYQLHYLTYFKLIIDLS